MPDVSAGVQLQLGAYTSANRAEVAWQRVQSKAPDLTSDLYAEYDSAQVRGRDVVRLRVGPFASMAEARSRCSSLKAAGSVPDCFATR